MNKLDVLAFDSTFKFLTEILVEKIQIKVSQKLALAFSKASGETRKRAEILLNIQLQQLLNPQTDIERLQSILEKGAKESA